MQIGIALIFSYLKSVCFKQRLTK